jgi:hypothetical protein
MPRISGIEDDSAYEHASELVSLFLYKDIYAPL